MDQNSKIPEVPLKSEVHHVTHQPYKSSSPPKHFDIPTKFHEGHEKDIPNPKDFMEHKKFEKMQHVAEDHLGGSIKTSEEGKDVSHREKGFLDKAKDVFSRGVNKIKNIFK